MSRTKDPEATRRKILEAAFLEIYRHGFQGASINNIIEAAGITKGALFHHYADKNALGYAVVDHIIGPLLMQRWLDPLRDTERPLAVLKRSFRQTIQQDIDSGHFVLGCPLNNLAQEMSPLDEGFQQRIDALYDTWRRAVADALEAGMQAGTVKEDISAPQVAALVVAAQMGIWGSAKGSRKAALMSQAGEAFCHYLDTLRPSLSELKQTERSVSNKTRRRH